MFESENLRIQPLYVAAATAASTSDKIRHYGGDFEILCQVGFCSSNGNGVYATDLACTAVANVAEFSVCEATAATAAGTVITGATLSLGPATACYTRGAVIGAIEVTSNLTTSVTININGIDYHTNTTGPGRDGENVATELAAVLNGRGTNQSVIHYEAIANELTTGVVVLKPIDDQGTGVVIYTTAAGSTYRPLAGLSQGVIRVNAGKLSTNYPKFIGVVVAETTYSVAKSVSYVSAGVTPGVTVKVTT